MAALYQEANEQNRQPGHPPKDCVECPLCNQSLIKTSEEERKAKATEIIKMANETQANYMGISRAALEEIQENNLNRQQR